MNSDSFSESADFKRIRRLFEDALDHEPRHRDAFLSQACGTNTRLLAEVRTLIESHEMENIDPPPLRTVEHLMEELDRGNLIGTRVGAYAIDSLIASGGMSHVYSATRVDGRFELEVAVKVLKRGMDTEEILRRFQLEQHALAKLDHYTICRLLDGGTLPDGRPYFAMERVHGISITDYCDQHQLSIQERLGLFEVVCDGIHYAHQRLIVHRDLKPANILVTAHGKPKILDFGIAKLLSCDSPFATTDVPSTSPHHPMTTAYASPEQLTRQTITTATDVYSLGVLLYEMLTGRRPFASIPSGTREHIEAMLSHDPLKPSKAIDLAGQSEPDDEAAQNLRLPAARYRARRISRRAAQRDLRGDLDNILLTALRSAPRERYASVEQFAADLERHARGLPVLARKDTMRYRSGKFLARHRLAVFGGLTFVLVLLVGTVVSITGFRQARAERDSTLAANKERAAVLEFVESMFTAGLYGRHPSQVSLVDILESAVDRLATESMDDEGAGARLETTLARLCARSGLNDIADRLLLKALETQERLLGPSSLAAANCCHSIAVHYRITGRLEDALTYAQRAVGIYSRLLHASDPDMIMGLTELGGTLSLLSRSEQAIPVLERAARIGRSDIETHRRQLVVCLNSLALARLAMGDVATGERLFLEARGYMVQEDCDFGIILNNMAKIRFLRRELDAAKQLVSRALSIQRKHLAYPHEDIALSLNNLALVAMAKDDLATAETHLREAISIYTSRFGDAHVSIASTLFNLGNVLRRQDDLTESLKAYRGALEGFQKAGGKRHPRIPRVEQIIAEVEKLVSN